MVRAPPASVSAPARFAVERSKQIPKLAQSPETGDARAIGCRSAAGRRPAVYQVARGLRLSLQLSDQPDPGMVVVAAWIRRRQEPVLPEAQHEARLAYVGSLATGVAPTTGAGAAFIELLGHLLAPASCAEFLGGMHAGLMAAPHHENMAYIHSLDSSWRWRSREPAHAACPPDSGAGRSRTLPQALLPETRVRSGCWNGVGSHRCYTPLVVDSGKRTMARIPARSTWAANAVSSARECG